MHTSSSEVEHRLSITCVYFDWIKWKKGFIYSFHGRWRDEKNELKNDWSIRLHLIVTWDVQLVGWVAWSGTGQCCAFGYRPLVFSLSLSCVDPGSRHLLDKHRTSLYLFHFAISFRQNQLYSFFFNKKKREILPNMRSLRDKIKS